jgi:hypothetical protein
MVRQTHRHPSRGNSPLLKESLGANLRECLLTETDSGSLYGQLTIKEDVDGDIPLVRS